MRLWLVKFVLLAPSAGLHGLALLDGPCPVVPQLLGVYWNGPMGPTLAGLFL
jgi:hypothetical protein